MLDVTPQIDEANNIILHMHPSVSTVIQQTKTFRISGSSIELQMPLSSIQESDNMCARAAARSSLLAG